MWGTQGQGGGRIATEMQIKAPAIQLCSLAPVIFDSPAQPQPASSKKKRCLRQKRAASQSHASKGQVGWHAGVRDGVRRVRQGGAGQSEPQRVCVCVCVPPSS